MRPILWSFVLLWFALFLPAASVSGQINSDVAKALVGTWVWSETMSAVTVNYEMILGGDGNFAFTSAMQTYRVTSTGTWIYESGWVQFKTFWSSSLDPTGQPVVVGPIHVLEVGSDFVRTPAGVARRAP